ncbi:class A beta-lactamase [Phytoactinopolyspora mesophila]|uniref:Beta-lactamase n=1 Tax=Phytoactinopolyspora mesophila TaxID=2650750 RepID=A0A7K3LZS6_9ACTN|nr:class A beta-lactamase [Phytoactinopolyspora mesophila]NDL56541.1 class A beta-lactamase [Phytoactinopolyspora mesophila]
MNVITALRRPAAVAVLAAATLLPLAACSTTEDTSATEIPTPPAATTPAAESTALPTIEPTDEPADVRLDERFEDLESAYDARLGVYVLDTGSGQDITYRADERFAYASTFKILLCAVVLDQHSFDDLEELITFSADDLQAHSPITSERVETGMTIRELCDAATRYGDNTAVNLLLDVLGGPSGLGEALKAAGDDVISVDRYAPELSEATPGDTRDTSTPRALATTLRLFALEDALPEDKRELLTEWMVGNLTGEDLIRAGIPDDWTVGDRTGAAHYGTRNCIAIVWPPDRDPILIALLTSRDTEDAERQDELIVEATEAIVDALT